MPTVEICTAFSNDLFTSGLAQDSTNDFADLYTSELAKNLTIDSSTTFPIFLNSTKSRKPQQIFPEVSKERPVRVELDIRYVLSAKPLMENQTRR
jgi:hypothetical protein